MSTTKLLGIAGSLRTASFSAAVLNALRLASQETAAMQIHSLRDVPLYNGDLDGELKPAGVAALISAIQDCDGLVIVTPEYNYGMPGVLKNALDWASRPAYQSALRDKPVLMISNSPGALGGIRAQNQLRETLAGTLSRVVPVPSIAVTLVKSKIDSGVFNDPASLKVMTDGLTVLIDEIKRLMVRVS